MNDQRSTRDQVTELLKLAREHGLYDAEDYIRGLRRGNDEAAPTGNETDCTMGMKLLGAQFGDWADRVEAERKVLRDALQWYVDHDDTSYATSNRWRIEGRRRALKALGLEE